MKNFSININNEELYIQQNQKVYVSEYSTFLASHIPSKLDGKIVCDYGSGTGVIAIICSKKNASKIICIEKEDEFIKILEKNISLNHLHNKPIIQRNNMELLVYNIKYDYIFCNPASLPNIAGDNPFYRGGEYGLDMITEVINFAGSHLNKDGHLYILVSSILPYSCILSRVRQLKMNYNIIKRKKIRFREHYEKIKEWVDKFQMQYPEMRYEIDNGELYEEIHLYDIFFENQL